MLNLKMTAVAETAASRCLRACVNLAISIKGEAFALRRRAFLALCAIAACLPDCFSSGNKARIPLPPCHNKGVKQRCPKLFTPPPQPTSPSPSLLYFQLQNRLCDSQAKSCRPSRWSPATTETKQIQRKQICVETHQRVWCTNRR